LLNNNKINVHFTYRDTNENTHKYTIHSIVYTYIEKKMPSNSFVQLCNLMITAGDAPMAVVHLQLS